VTGNPALTRDIKSALDNSGLILYDALSYYIRPNFDLERMMPSLEFTAELGFPYAMAICDDPDWAREVDNFGRFCDAVAKLGMTVAMEAPVTQNTVNTLPMALQVIAEAGRPNPVICLDPLHFMRSGHTPDDLKGLDPKLFPYTQRRHRHRHRRPRHAPTGHGPGLRPAQRHPGHPARRYTAQHRVESSRPRVRLLGRRMGQNCAGRYARVHGRVLRHPEILVTETLG